VWCKNCEISVCFRCALADHRLHNSRPFGEARSMVQLDLETAMKKASDVSIEAEQSEKMLEDAIVGVRKVF
jgi:hypothetical protein